ncbi:unnamed protein product [Trichobilharzia regenti]|nr:unnamed protein product [Trichobilharzia regenti]
MLIDSFMAFTKSISTSDYPTNGCRSCYTGTISYLLFTPSGTIRFTY